MNTRELHEETLSCSVCGVYAFVLKARVYAGRDIDEAEWKLFCFHCDDVSLQDYRIKVEDIMTQKQLHEWVDKLIKKKWFWLTKKSWVELMNELFVPVDPKK